METQNNRILPLALALAALALNLSAIQPARAASFVSTNPMNKARRFHTTILLPNGKVLAAGGSLDTTAELFDPATETWTLTGEMRVPRSGHSATLLRNGQVLVAGGYSHRSNTIVPSAELYDPTSGTWASTEAMRTSREGHMATLLPNGKVLVAGGFFESGGLFRGLSSAELYDPDSGTWSNTGTMTTDRNTPRGTLLFSGKVLVVGGDGSTSAELYDPLGGTWTATGSLDSGHDGHTVTLLLNGKVLVQGGSRVFTAELYDPASGAWTATGSLSWDRLDSTATLLRNGQVLVAGGYSNGSNTEVPSAELYDPITGTWTEIGMNEGRFGPAATLLPNENVLVTGGHYPNNDLSSAEIYNWAGDAPPFLTMLRNADQRVSLSWTGAGTLEETASLTAPNWQPATDQANPQTVSPTGAMRFYRVKAESNPHPPSIVAQPRSKAVVLGQPVTLSLTVVGSLPLSYQWRKDAQDIPGASQATYSIAAVQSNHLGAYTMTVTNQYGAETSQVARLTAIQVIAGCSTRPIVSQYRFEEGAPDQAATGGGSILDFVDGSADGTPSGNPLYRADVGWTRVGACQCETNTLSLELSSGQSVKINSPFIFHDQYGDATLEFLVKPAQQGHVSLFWTRPNNDDRNRFNIAINSDGGFGFDYRDPTGELHLTPSHIPIFQIPVDAWTHIAVVRDTQSSAPAHTYDFYVNGVFTTTLVDPDPYLPTSDQAWQISGRGGFYYIGSVDEIRFSARKLTPDEFLISQKICIP